MIKSKFFIIVPALFVWIVVSAGCGGAASLTSTAPPKPAPEGDIDPFGADNVDLKESKETVTAVYDPDDVAIPGAEYGLKAEPKAKKRKGKKRGRKKAAAPNKVIPHSDAIEEQMKGLPWGLKYTSVLAYFEQQIRERYDADLKAASGAIEEDRIRSRMLRDIEKLRQSFIEFKGQRTGFEGSLVENEFTHNNGESMLMYDAGKYVEYLFFFDGRFWKRMRAFRKDELQGLNFDAYVSTLTNRFGEGKEIYNDKAEFAEIKWKDDNTYMTAEDRSSFFGVYVLIFSARLTQDNLAELRRNADRKGGGPSEEISGMVTSVTSGNASDTNTSVIDAYTGRQGSSTPSSETDVASSESSGGKKKKNNKKKESESSSTSEESSDELIDDLF